MACRPAWAVVGRAEMVLTSQPGPGMCPMAAWPISEVQGPCHADCFYLQHFIFVGNLRKTYMALLSACLFPPRFGFCPHPLHRLEEVGEVGLLGVCASPCWQWPVGKDLPLRESVPTTCGAWRKSCQA